MDPRRNDGIGGLHGAGCTRFGGSAAQAARVAPDGRFDGLFREEIRALYCTVHTQTSVACSPRVTHAEISEYSILYCTVRVLHYILYAHTRTSSLHICRVQLAGQPLDGDGHLASGKSEMSPGSFVQYTSNTESGG